MQPETLLAMFYEDAPDVMCVLGSDLDIIQTNAAVYTVLGRHRAELLQGPFLSLISPEDAALAEAAIRRCERPQTRQHFVARSVHLTGETRWLRWTITRGPDNRYYLVGRDITSVRDEESWLRVFQQAIDASPLSVVITDAVHPGHRVIYVNKAFQKTTGYSAEDMLGQNCRILQGDDTDQEELATIRAALTNYVACDVTVRNYRKDGSLFYNRLYLAPVRDANGRVIYYVGMQDDVTQKVLAKQALERNLQQRSDQLEDERTRLRQVVNTMPIILSDLDLEGRILLSEGLGLALIDLEPGTLVGLNAFEIYQDWPQHLEDIRRAMNGEETNTIIELGPYVFDTHHAPRYNDNQEIVGVVGIAVDVTERYHAQRQVEAALERMRDLNKTHNNFVSMVSHEFRTPLTNIMNSAQLLHRSEHPPVPQKRNDRYERIYRNIRNMTELVDDILKLGETEEDAQHFQPELLDLRVLCNDLCEQYDPKQRRIRHTFAVEGTVYKADSKLLKMALGNLLSNALKYSDQAVTFHVEDHEGGVRFTVEDKGIGVPEADQEGLFRHFYRASNAGHLPGSGLGLAITQRAARLHGGELTFESAIDEGTTFYLVLPRNA